MHTHNNNKFFMCNNHLQNYKKSLDFREYLN